MVPPSGCASSPKETNAELCVTAIHPGRALHVGCGAPPASGPGAWRLRRGLGHGAHPISLGCLCGLV